MSMGDTVELEAVQAGDFETMLALRSEAMRESLERLGRFDPTACRARLVTQFMPECMRHLCVADERVGYFTLMPRANAFYLRHGFELVRELEVDIEYRWVPPGAAS